MSPAHVHLILNHVPVLGVMFGLAFLLFGALRHNAVIVRAALVLFVVAAVFAVPTYFTGEPAEEAVEHLAGVAEATIERHEDAAKIALISTALLGSLGLLFLIQSRRRTDVPKAFVATMLFLSLVTAGVLAWTANLGGEIRHTEIAAQAVGGEPGPSAPAARDDDD